jgi:hypothetical protein
MHDMRSTARSMRLRAEEGATAEELDLGVRRSGVVSDVERIALEAYAWALVRVARRAAMGKGEKDDRRP